MAEGKKSFILYSDLIHTVKRMPHDKAGALFKTILEYVNDENPVLDDLLLEIAFEPIKQQLKRDLRRFEEFKKKQSENGKLGGRPKRENPENPSLILETQKSLNDNVNVNDTDIKYIVSKGDESPTHTKEQIESFKRFQDWIKENAPRVAKMKEPFTIKQYFSLDKEGYNGESIKNLLMNMHNYKPLDKNISAYRTLTNWHKRDQNAK